MRNELASRFLSALLLLTAAMTCFFTIACLNFPDFRPLSDWRSVTATCLPSPGLPPKGTECLFTGNSRLLRDST